MTAFPPLAIGLASLCVALCLVVLDAGAADFVRSLWQDKAPEWLAAWATLLAVLVAVFNEQIRARVWRPRLTASIQTALPDCVAIPIYKPDTEEFVADGMFLRMRVKNHGNATAKNVEVFAAGLQVQRNGSWDDVHRFPPGNLSWADQPHPTLLGQLVADREGAGRYCNLGHIIDPNLPDLHKPSHPVPDHPNQTSLEFSLGVKP